MAEDNVPKVFCDSGWNDPPLYSYESLTSHNKKSSLNKRITYSSSITNDFHNSAMKVVSDGKIAPPITGSSNCSGTSTAKHILNTDNNPFETFQLTNVLQKLELTMKELYISENEKDVCEIKRRLALMEKMWNDDKFPRDVKQKLFDISKALQENDLVVCDKLQRSLMVDYTSICSSWMAAIRMLINSKRTFNEKLSEY